MKKRMHQSFLAMIMTLVMVLTTISPTFAAVMPETELNQSTTPDISLVDSPANLDSDEQESETGGIAEEANQPVSEQPLSDQTDEVSDQEKAGLDTSQAKLTTINLKGTDTRENLQIASEVASVFSNAHYVSGTLQFTGVTGTDWYYKTLTGTTNSLNNITLGAAFEKGKLIEIAVDSADVSKVNFVLELPADQLLNQDYGQMTVQAANNCTNTDQIATVPVNLVQLEPAKDSGIVVDNPNADNPSYTISVHINGGALKQRLEPKDFYFDGAFSGVTVNSVVTDADKKGFTIKISKASNSDTLRARTGNLFISGDIITYVGTAELLKRDISLGLPDEYVPKRVGTTGGGSSSVVIDGVSVSAKILTQTLTVATMVLNKANNTAAFSTLGYVNIIFDLVIKLSAAEKESATDQIKAQIAEVSRQLDNSTEEILNGQKRSDLLARLNNLNSAANKLDNSYDATNTATRAAISSMANNQTEGQYKAINVAMTNVYSTENNNYTYYDNMINLGREITGENVVLTDVDIFTAYKNLAAINYDWSSQTIDGRKAFNQTLADYYGVGYGILLIGMQYDYDSNEAKANAMIEAIKEMETLKSSGEVNASDVVAIDQAIAEYGGNLLDGNNQPNGGEIGLCRIRMQQTKENMDKLKSMQVKVSDYYNKAQNALNEDVSKIKKQQVVNYRTGKTYHMTLQGLPGYLCCYRSSDDKTVSEVKGILLNHASQEDYEKMIQASKIRKYRSFQDELVEAGLVDVRVRYSYKETYHTHSTGGSVHTISESFNGNYTLKDLDSPGFYLGRSTKSGGGTLMFSKLKFNYVSKIINFSGVYTGDHQCFQFTNLLGKLGYEQIEKRNLLFLIEV